MNKPNHSKWPIAALACALACLFVWGYGLSRLDNLAARSAHIGVRYAEPTITQESLSRLRHDIDPENNTLAGCLAWREDGSKVLRDDVSGRSDEATQLLLYGDGTLLVDSSRFLLGNPPDKDDPDSIAISSALAQAIFGSTDLLGQPIYDGEETYTISGIFDDGKEKTLLRQHKKNDKDYQFNALELTRTPNESGTYGTAQEQVADFCNQTGLPQGEATLDYASTVSMLRLVAALPCLAIAIILLVRVGQSLVSTHGWAGKLAYGALMALVAALAVWAVAQWVFWPQEWLPTRWSYFEFWGERWQQVSAQFDAIFSLPAQTPDLLRRKGELATLASLVAALFLVFPGSSFRRGSANQYAICSFGALLAAFALCLHFGLPFERPLFMTWLLFFGGSALLAIMHGDFPPGAADHPHVVSPSRHLHEVEVDIRDADTAYDDWESDSWPSEEEEWGIDLEGEDNSQQDDPDQTTDDPFDDDENEDEALFAAAFAANDPKPPTPPAQEEELD